MSRMTSIPEFARIWELSKVSISAWAAAGTLGYFLYLRPKWYPNIEHPKAREFTPREVEEWNEMQKGLSSGKR